MGGGRWRGKGKGKVESNHPYVSQLIGESLETVGAFQWKGWKPYLSNCFRVDCC